MERHKPPIPILIFADSVLGIQPYDWQCEILLNYEARHPTAAACANFTGKTSVVFPGAALWTLYNFPRARVMYLSATGAPGSQPVLRQHRTFPHSTSFLRMVLARNRSGQSRRRVSVRTRLGYRRQYRGSPRSTRFASRLARR